MKKTAQAAALVSALFFSAGVIAQNTSGDVVTKPAPSTESKPPQATSEKSRSEVKNEAKGAPVGTLKPNSDESKPPAGASTKTRAEARHEDSMKKKQGTTPDGVNEPDSAYKSTPAPQAK